MSAWPPPFTERQREAIRHERHALLAAGAGSGKTTTLVGKIMHALGAEVLPGERVARPCELGEVAAITFTNAAAADLKADLRAAMRAEAARTGEAAWRGRIYDVDRARIGTIHGFCGQVLREFGLRAGLDPRFRVLDEAETALLRAETVREAFFDALRRGEEAPELLAGELGVRRTLELLDHVVATGEAVWRARERWAPGGMNDVRLDELRAAIEGAGGDWREQDHPAAVLAAALLELGGICRARLDRALDERVGLDFDALISRTRDLLRDRPDALAALRGRLRWLFIDEFQDTDPAQTELAYLLCGLPADVPDAPRLCIVGDPKQSIYRFRRADVGLWNRVTADLRALGIEPIPLDVNFRSRRPIVDWVNAVFSRLMPAEASGHDVAYGPLRAYRDLPGDDRRVEALAVSGESAEDRRRDEAERVVARMRALREDADAVRERDASRPARWADFAVLFRTRTALPHYEAALRRHAVPYVVAGNVGFFGRREVRDVGLLLAALADPDDDIALAGVLRSPFVGLADAALYRLRLGSRRPLRRRLRLEAGGAEPDDLAEFPDADRERLVQAAGWLRELLALRDRIPCAALLEHALDGSGYAAHVLFEEGGEIAAANLRKLIAIAETRAWSVRELADYLELRAAATREPEATVHTAGEDVVTLTTVHQAKGLEWPIVFLADLERDVLGGGRAGVFADAGAGIAVYWKGEGDQHSGAFERLRQRDAELDRAEEKRVWYVAATRARDRLVLCADPATDAAAPEAARRVSQWLLGGLARDAEGWRYDGDGAERHVPLVRQDATADEAPPPPEPPDAARLEDIEPDPELARRIAPLPPGHGRAVHSASELMLFSRDREEHRRVYGLGLPPRFASATPLRNEDDVAAEAAAQAEADAAAEQAEAAAEQLELLPARALSRLEGELLHGVLERLELLEDLDRLLDLELGGRLGDGAPDELRRALRRELREMIEATATHERVAPLLGRSDASRELAFTWFVRDGESAATLRGAMDLVAGGDDGPRLIDYKSNRAAGREEETAARYAIQRDVYVAALAELTGRAPADFAFFFARTGRPVPGRPPAEPFDAGEIEAARDRVLEVVRRIRAGGVDGGDEG